ncbi:hypothetical protein YYC_01708 [Plasmodium yoelii 17X]|uniref:Uncharacterized protein n=3 Tax=Plasmodium yoelii TaxID=5861 RepID=A0AAF0B6D3_PLAYO|nr:conserved Plasmodium protein, unknown function [Plasmodium yoelii]ETB61931.1 hypothetical protein YYC_01708 [Plasmodium yoelii 17X]WBY61198.1 hypothetical protein Py17XNL_001401390 [Plasmodium yoelii yoelii]CDU20907.1 conserved Plasmodium protein, unknown function [Plasmodium yoelii]VTZ81873.1 conserved Plasmodium protein, unknown function [Plasmodium yoelii]|eukprot:XP_022813031.1 conserved Plasmodium protein, unknown function [Plasmodium yoelii]
METPRYLKIPRREDIKPVLHRKDINLEDEKTEFLCFICLEKNLKDFDLYPCCSLCSAVVHKKCWYKLRKTQKLSSLRSKLLGLNKLDPILCTICKTGVAKIEEEEGDDFKWAQDCNSNKEYLQDELLRTIYSVLNNGITNNDNNNFILHSRYIFFFNLVFLIVLITLTISLILFFKVPVPYAFLISLLILYEVIVLQIVIYFYIKIKYN